MSNLDVDDVVNLSDKNGPIRCEVGGIKIVLRRIKSTDLEEVHRLMRAVPWNTLLQDVKDGYSVRPDALFGAFLLEDPETLVSHCAVTRWGDHHAYLGWYVTDKAYRGYGIGSLVFKWARKCAGDVPVVLDADPGMDVIYARVGFQKVRETYQIKGIAKLPETPPETTETNKELIIEKLNDANFNLLADYDKQFFPVDRSKLLKVSYISPPVRETKMALLNGRCVGYLCIRYTGDELHTLCPLIADNSNIADLLIYDVIKDHQLEGKYVNAFAPDANTQARAVLDKYCINEQVSMDTNMCTDPDAYSRMTVPWYKVYATLFNNISF